MKILVAVKRVLDYQAHIRIKPDHSGIETTNAKMVLNPFDAIALEEALRLKEKNIAKEIIAVSIGPSAVLETLRTALAMGADRALLLQTENETQPLTVAKLLRVIVEREAPQLVLLGKQAVDDDCNQTGQMLAGLLDWPQGTFASRVEVGANKVKVTREIDGGLETLSLTLPAVITSDLRLNEPRYISLPNIMQAKKKPLEIIAANALGIDLEPRLKILKVTEPNKRRAGKKVENAEELALKLKHEAQVI